MLPRIARWRNRSIWRCVHRGTWYFSIAQTCRRAKSYDVRIRRAIEKSELFIFLLSPDALEAGSYTLTELAIAQKSWQHPAGRLLPVILRPVGLGELPAYLKAVTLLEPEGNTAAGVADAVHRICLARRRARLKTLFIGASVASIVCVAAYVYWGDAVANIGERWQRRSAGRDYPGR